MRSRSQVMREGSRSVEKPTTVQTPTREKRMSSTETLLTRTSLTKLMGHTVPSAYAYVVSPVLIHVTKIVDSLSFQPEEKSGSGMNLPMSRRTTSTSSENAILLATRSLAFRFLGPDSVAVSSRNFHGYRMASVKIRNGRI